MGDSLYHTERSLAKILYANLRLRNTWGGPPKEDAAEIVRAEDSDDGFIADLAFSESGSHLVACASSGDVYVFEPHSGKLKFCMRKAHNDPVTRVRFVSDMQFLSGSVDCTLALWDLRNPKAPLNILRGHSSPIRSIDFDENSNMIISSSLDAQVRYWHLPSFQQPKTEYSSDDESLLGILFSCSNLNHLCISHNTAVCINAHGTMFLIGNLDVRHVKEDFRKRRIRFDESIKMQLCWFDPNASFHSKNRVCVIESDEYCPVPGALVSKISHVLFHPTLPLLLMRITTSRKAMFRQETRDWTCICNMQQWMGLGTSYGINTNFYGSNVFRETLVHANEETRYASFREKKPDFTSCGRLIASPDKYGVRLLGYLDQRENGQNSVKTESVLTQMFQSSRPSFWPSGPSELAVVRTIERPTNSTICCKFAPNDLILAVGDSKGHVSFYQPQL